MRPKIDISQLGENYTQIIKDIRAKQKVSCFGVGISERMLMSCMLGQKVLYIAPDYVSAKRIYELFAANVGEVVSLFPAGIDNLIYKEAVSTEQSAERLACLTNLALGKTEIVISYPEAVLSFAPNPKTFSDNIFSLEVGGRTDTNALAKKLVQMGYKQEQLVQSAGQFSLRGDILDVFAIGNEHPYRIDFFDIEIDRISVFDENTQKHLSDVKSIVVAPFCENILSENKKQDVLNELKKQKTIVGSDDFSRIIEKLEFKLEQGIVDSSLNFCSPFFENYSIFDYFDRNSVVVIDECKAVYDAFSAAEKEHASRRAQLAAEKMYFNTEKKSCFDFKSVLARISEQNALAFLKVTTNNSFFSSDKVYSFKTAPIVRYSHNLGEFASAMQIWLNNGYSVFVCAGDKAGAEHIQSILENHEIYLQISDSVNFGFGSCISTVMFPLGFILPDQKVVVVGTYDIFPRKNQVKMHARRNTFSVPKVGDYVVHEIHGIGLCEGVTKLTGKFGTKDYVVVRYAGTDKLYVPIDQLDMLERFSGAEAPKKLSKIGGAEFAGVKERVRNGVRKMAFDLLALYAERESKKGFVFPADDALQLEFENAFPYTETEDQLTSIEEIKSDMQNGKVMDRLLCGDVGFGKTEVALRAAFKAVIASKQVAFLAPTTILSEQHYETARKRFESFGVRIAVLNRFKTDKEKKAILKDLENGNLDIIFGTHRLLSKDVKFHDLGLIVLDEEQKFGVADKEKLKLLKKNVDVLSLSATPIPRTLHMSLSGIRDISIISSPPNDRLPVQTSVTENLDSVVADAINREISRGGQVFYVYNRVETIYKELDRLRAIVPNAKIVVGHGQLPANELEQAIYEFSSGRADVLLATTIIENGIDISNANTLIVQNADRLGLSQLYQIRGRVGRGNRVAYAYFLYDESKVLSEEAYKRLDAISEFTEFGSGFKVAMRDLEIRGSGNILGSEQHGHMQKVGYDMYCRILASEIARLKGEEEVQNKEVLLKIETNAYISDKYIENDEMRMAAYKDIAQIKSLEAKEKIENDLVVSYGKMPQETKNLIEVAYIKSLARPLDIVEIESSTAGIKFTFEPNSEKMHSEHIANAVYKFRTIAALDLARNRQIRLATGEMSAQERLALIKDFLLIANNLKK